MDNAEWLSHLKDARKKKNLTQQKLGDKLGVSSSTVAKWESGVLIPHVSMWNRIAEELDLPFKWGQIQPEAESIEHTEELRVEETNKTEILYKQNHRGLFIGIIAGFAIIGIALAVFFTFFNRTQSIRVVDEYLDEASMVGDYDIIYQVAIEYKGNTTHEKLEEYADLIIKDYKKWYEEADAIIFTFWKKYDDKLLITNADYFIVYLP